MDELKFYANILIFAAMFAELAFFFIKRRKFEIRYILPLAGDIAIMTLLLKYFTLRGDSFEYMFNYRLFTFDMAQPWNWLALLLLMEFFYYVTHYVAHHVPMWWAYHSVHHSPTELNIMTGSIVGWTTVFFGFSLVMIPALALVGFPAESIYFMIFILYNFQRVMHSEWFPRLGVLDYFFNTPSSHRVHHSTEKELRNKNYGGMLLIFDHLFGTFVPEPRRPLTYGVSRRKTFNPILYPLVGYETLWTHIKREKTGMRKFLRMFTFKKFD